MLTRDLSLLVLLCILHICTQRYCVRSLALLPALDMPVTIAIYLASPACHRQYLCLMRRHRLVPASSPTTHACPYSGWQLHIPGGLTFEIKAVDKIEGVLREKKAVNNTKPSSRWNCSQDNLRYSITIHMSSGSLKATLYWFIRKSPFFSLLPPAMASCPDKIHGLANRVVLNYKNISDREVTIYG